MIGVRIFLKAGGVIAFSADDVNVELEEDGQKIREFTWENAIPALQYVHLDNIAAIQTYALP